MNRTYSKRVVICGSMSSYPIMLEVSLLLSDMNVDCIVPEKENSFHSELSKEDFEGFKRRVSYDYLQKIKYYGTSAILIINPKKHNIDNYIGPNTFAEIAVAFASKKKIFVYYEYPAIYEDELTAWGAIELKGELDILVAFHKKASIQEIIQPSLFSLSN